MVFEILFLIGRILLAAFFVHNFWTLPKEQMQAEKVNFMKNLALVGALLMLLQIQNWPYSIAVF